eukprot:scaffold34928_cov54-Attheya_sp.AAC.1
MRLLRTGSISRYSILLALLLSAHGSLALATLGGDVVQNAHTGNPVQFLLHGRDYVLNNRRMYAFSSTRRTIHSTESLSSSSHSINTALSATPRGGARKNQGPPSADEDGASVAQKTIKTVIGLSAAVLLSYFGWEYRATFATLFNKEKFKAWLLVTLRDINEMGLKGLVIYAVVFAFWEFGGFPTVPVETVAGMSFGIKHGIIASGAGKLAGAFLAYTLGRGLLNEPVRSRFADNEVLSLIDHSVEAKPFRIALLMKYSSFPEVIKNFGLAIMPPIKPWMFLLATMIHGLPFTALWTFLGHDSASRLRAAEVGLSLPANGLLQGLVVGVGVFGVIISPTLVGLWIRDMRREKLESESQKKV